MCARRRYLDACRVGFAAALLAVALSLSHEAPTASAAVLPDGYGVNAQLTIWQLSPSYWATNFSEIHAAGVQTVRADAFWDRVEPAAPDATGHHYDWGQTDYLAYALAVHGLRWEPIADYSAPWAGSYAVGGIDQIHSPPTNYGDYVSYAAALAARYGPNGSFWAAHPGIPALPIKALEVWNEPDSSWAWEPSPDAGAYARLYAQTRDAVHASAPGVEVLVGGVSGHDTSFLDSLYSALGGAGRIDGLAVHSYDGNPVGVVSGVAAARQVMDAHGDANVPIDLTEFGWPAGPGQPYTDAQRAQMLSQVVNTVAGSDCNVERIFPHTWSSAEADTANVEDWYGLASPDGTEHLSATQLAATYRALEQTPVPARASYSACGRPLSISLLGSSGTPSTTPTTLLPTLSSPRPTRSSGAGKPRERRLATRTRKVKRGHKAKRHPNRRGRRHRRGSASAARGCVEASVQSAGTPIAGATVTFTLSWGSQRRSASALTNARGVASACLAPPPGSAATIEAIAADSAFALTPSARISI